MPRTASDAAVRRVAAGRPAGSVSVAALDLASGVTLAYGARSGMREGSVAKVFILETLLLQRQHGTSLGLSEHEMQTLKPMIEHSDNPAADEMMQVIGGRRALVAAMPRLRLVSTVPGPGIYKGLTTTSATDQITMLQNLVRAGGPLTPTSQKYVLGLMGGIDEDQDWGVSAAGDPGTDFNLKNGWLSVIEDDGRWLTNSIGVVTVKGHRVLMAVLTQHNTSFAGGVTLVEALAKAAASAL